MAKNTSQIFVVNKFRVRVRVRVRLRVRPNPKPNPNPNTIYFFDVDCFLLIAINVPTCFIFVLMPHYVSMWPLSPAPVSRILLISSMPRQALDTTGKRRGGQREGPRKRSTNGVMSNTQEDGNGRNRAEVLWGRMLGI